jgi:hypothetical protein
MQRYLGMMYFYRRFLPGIASTLRSLTSALSGNPKVTLEAGHGDRFRHRQSGPLAAAWFLQQKGVQNRGKLLHI